MNIFVANTSKHHPLYMAKYTFSLACDGFSNFKYYTSSSIRSIGVVVVVVVVVERVVVVLLLLLMLLGTCNVAIFFSALLDLENSSVPDDQEYTCIQ